MSTNGRGALNDRGHVPSDLLGLRRLGSLGEERAKAVEAHLESCPRCQAAARELEEDAGHFEQIVLPRTLPRIRRAEAGRPRWRWARRWWWTAPLASSMAAAAILLVVESPTEPGEVVRAKGEPAWQVVAKRAEAVFKVGPSSRLRPGDRLRFVVESGAGLHLTIAAKDSTGQVTRYYPAPGVGSRPLPEGRVELPGSVELDDAPGRELLVAIFTEAPVPFESIAATLGEPASSLSEAERFPEAAHVLVLEYQKEIP